MSPPMNAAVFLDRMIFGLIRPARGPRWAVARRLGVISATTVPVGVGFAALLYPDGTAASLLAAICLATAAALGWLAAAGVCEQERRKFRREHRRAPSPRA